MLKSLTIENLGIFDDSSHKFNLKKKTLLIGPNNVGKSLVISAINIVKHIIVKRQMQYLTDLYNLMSFADAVHLHDTTRMIKIVLVFEEPNCPTYEISIDNTNKFEFKYSENGKLLEHLTQEVGEVFDTRHVKRFADIWYVTPTRTLLPTGTEVGTSQRNAYQAIAPNGDDVVQFLLERYNDHDPKWVEAEGLLRRFDPNMTLLKIPIIGRRTHAETSRTYGSKTAPVNLRMQGSGIQNAITIISVALFSPKGSTICIEEPENSLHPKAQKNLIDILITIAKSQDKQIILTTHSDHIALALFDALGKGKMKGEELGVYSFSFKQNSSRIEIEEIKEFEESLVKSFDGDDDLFKMFSEAIRKAGAY